MIDRTLPTTLQGKSSFSRREYVDAMTKKYHMTNPQIAYDLEKRLNHGEIVRKGWGQYTISEKPQYHYSYSDFSKEIAKQLNEEYYDLDYRIGELYQLNDFMNHQVAHNTIFVWVEYEFVDYVFESLFNKYPGKVMRKPNDTDYYRYLQDEEIVVLRLPSETPKGLDETWHIRLEQVVVDVFVDKLISKIVPEGEKNAILSGAVDSYLIDEKTMIRYAKRKGVGKRMEQVLEKYKEAEAV